MVYRADFRRTYVVGDRVECGRHTVEITEVVNGCPVAAKFFRRQTGPSGAETCEREQGKPSKCPRRVLRFLTSGLYAALQSDIDEPTYDRLACRLAASPDTRVRADLVSEPRLGLATLAKLSRDWWWEIRAGVAVHPNASPQILETLAHDVNSWVRRAVAEREDVPASCLELLSGDDDFGVRDAVAEHPRCPYGAMVKLSKDRRWEIRRSIAKRPDAPPEILAALASDQETWVRFFVACNQATPPEVARGFASDESRALRLSMRKKRGTLLRPVALFLALDPRTAAAAKGSRQHI